MQTIVAITPWVASNYHLVFTRHSKDFLNPAGTQLENRNAALFSMDQEFGKQIGSWARLGWQTDDAAVNYDEIYSGGIDLKGAAWARDDDNIGVGLAYLNGGNLNIDRTHIAEAYYRWQLNEQFGVTADIQYQNDDYKTGRGPSAYTYGLRVVLEF